MRFPRAICGCGLLGSNCDCGLGVGRAEASEVAMMLAMRTVDIMTDGCRE